MVHNKLFISILIGFIGAVKALPTEQWKAPFNDASKLAMLCTDNNHKFIYTDRMREAISHLLQSNRTSHICVKTTDPIPNTKYDGLIWLIQSIQSCNVVKEIKRGFKGEIFDVAFQQNMLKVAFAMVCQKTDDIGVYNLQFYADIFRILFEKKNEDRTVICLNVKEKYENMYGKCHVINRVNYTTYTMDYIMKICDGNSAYSMIKVVDFFRTFARSCDTPQHFYEEHKDTVYKSFGRALANDTTFMNSLSTHLKSAISAESILPHLMLKTRLLLQHFSIAAIKIYKRIQLHQRCSRIEKKNNIFDGEEEANETNYYTQVDPNEETSLVGNEECNMSESILYDDLMENMGGFQVIGSQAELGIYVELGLLICVVVNSIFLSILLFQTQSHLSTATILFIFNILFSNFLFVASFCVLFSDLVSTEPYGSITENTMSQNKSASYVIAETLQSHLFAPQEFLKHMIQETLFSLSQNGSLLGLTHLLVLVLVVINKSMSGKAIRLSKSCVIMVFAFVWIFLIITHVAFSTLQIDAISNLDSLLVGIKPTYRDSFFACSNPIRLKSEYLDIGERCALVEPYHKFGVYLLRGHTLFTLIFLAIALIVFIVTFIYHFKVRSQHEVLKFNQHRDYSPHKRRETLFNTLLLSITAFFVSVLGQSFIEIVVFWLDNPDDVANYARWYQVMRIASFVDPLLNPLLVSVRTPVIRRKLRMLLYVFGQHLIACCCPWKFTGVSRKHRKNGKSGTRRTSSTTGDSSVYKTNDSEVTFRIWCTRQYVRTSLFGKSANSGNKNYSVV